MSRPHGEEKGYLALILHAHLPFVRHPENRHHLEELWLFEAITDTYLPLLDLMEGWVEDGIPFHLTMSITPPLASMLADPLLQRRYVEHLERSIALAHREMRRTQHQPHVHRLARMYRDRFLHARKAFLQRYRADLLNAFSRFRAHGLELIASAATHALLPLTEPHISAAAAQIRAGVEHHRQVFRETPCGFWLPECGYSPNLDHLLVKEGIRYTIVDTHGVLHARPRPLYAVYSPVYTPRGLAVFGRDVETSKQVWSTTEGYPGDPVYREFYRDIGYDLPWEELSPYLPWGVRTDTGFKYHRITGRTHHKEFYDPDLAQERAREHAPQLRLQPDSPDPLLGATHGPKAGRRRAVRRRAFRALVVRRPVVFGRSHPPRPPKPARVSPYHTQEVSGGAPHPPGRRGRHVHLGIHGVL